MAPEKLFRLRIEKGAAFVGKQIDLDPDRSYTLGKSDTCDQQLPGPSVSRRHLSLHWVNNAWVVEDLNTTNGTEVNGLRVTKQALKDGDHIELGSYVLRLIGPSPTLPEIPPHAPEALLPAAGAMPGAQTVSLEDFGEVEEAEDLLRKADINFEHREEYRAAQVKDSTRRYTLTLAAQLGIAAVLLGAATLLAVYGKSLFRSARTSATKVTIELPHDFERAIQARDLKAADNLLRQARSGTAPAPELLNRMEAEFQRLVESTRRDLRAKASLALQSGDWRTLDEAMAAATNPLLAPLGSEWDEIRSGAKQRELFVAAERARAAGFFDDALQKLAEAEKLFPNNQKLHLLRSEIQNEMGAGLLVRVPQRIAGTTILTDERTLGPANTKIWKLPVGLVRIVIVAPGHFAAEREVPLEYGELKEIDVDLQPLPSDAAWAMFSLRSPEHRSAQWVAAKFYATGSSEPARQLAENIAVRAEDDARREAGTTDFRVVELILQDGQRIKGQLLGQGSGALSLRELPSGEPRTVRSDNVQQTTDLSLPDAVSLVIDWIAAERSRGADPIETFGRLSKLYFQSQADWSVFAPLASNIAAECLRKLEGGCASCAALGKVPCPACNAAGRAVQIAACDRCNGAKTVKCFRCKGAGVLECDNCGGNGVIERVVANGIERRTVRNPCRPCRSTGRVRCSNGCNSGTERCPRCKGAGQIEQKATCPECERGRLRCSDCSGAGTRDGMQPESRFAAEQAAAFFGR